MAFVWVLHAARTESLKKRHRWLAMQYAALQVVSCFDAAILTATSSHYLEFWNDQLLEVLGTRTKDNVLLLESITLSS